jgi:hypothetical protein
MSHQRSDIARFDGLWWLAIALLIGLKLFLIADVQIDIRLSPHDDSLYVKRAFSLLHGVYLGPYDSHTLSKLPGISLWLAAVRLVGIPHLLAVNCLYIVAGLYLVQGAGVSGISQRVLFPAFAVFLFNPITLGADWGRVLREPLSCVLTLGMLGALLHILVARREKAIPWPHIAVWAILFSFSLLLREEDRLLWGLLLLFSALAAWVWQQRHGRRLGIKIGLLVALVPAVLALSVNWTIRSAIEGHYGLPLLHDFGEGEFPKLMAAIRSIDSKTDNRLVMIPQDTLLKLRDHVPEFAPLVDRIPAVGPRTYSCQLQGVCTEWSNGWMLWWVKDAAAGAGKTPDLVTGQAYFKAVRERIESLCQSGEFQCHDRGSGILPPMELRWTRAFLAELGHLAGILLFPTPHLEAAAAGSLNVPPALGQMYAAVTMTSTLANAGQLNIGEEMNQSDFAIAAANLRGLIGSLTIALCSLLLVTGSAALILRWTLYPGIEGNPVYWLALLFWLYSLIRLCALGYVSVFFGPFDPRMIYSTHISLAFLAPLIISDCYQARRQYLSLRP